MFYVLLPGPPILTPQVPFYGTTGSHMPAITPHYPQHHGAHVDQSQTLQQEKHQRKAVPSAPPAYDNEHDPPPYSEAMKDPP